MVSKAQIFFLTTCAASGLTIYLVHKYQNDEREVRIRPKVLYQFNYFYYEESTIWCLQRLGETIPES